MGKKNNKDNHLYFRLNIVFLVTFILFSALIFRLGLVQIVQGEDYFRATERNTERTVTVAAPRGWILDRNYEVIVDNEPKYSVTFTQQRGIPTDEYEEIASRLAEMLDDIDEEKILSEMNRGMTFTPQRIKQGISVEEMFRIAEHLDELPGVGVMVDSDRQYVHDELFRTFLGSIGPITAENVSYYLAKGYEMNEIVGRSGIETQYEEQLRGIPTEMTLTVDRRQRPVGEAVYNPGRRGNDLVLTIDLEFQQAIEEIIQKYVEDDEWDIPEDRRDLHPLFVAMNPHTGEIYGMSNNVSTYQGNYYPGSTIKMATVLMGLHEGVVTPQTRFADTGDGVTIGGVTFRSWRSGGLGSMDAERAIQRSSNVYMVQVGLRMANPNFSSGGRIALADAIDTFELMRMYFAQFGLGVPTGIDLPNEGAGLLYPAEHPIGDLAQNTFGQHDHYTTLQLAQYTSVIANGGNRVQPHLVKEIRRGVPSEDEVSEVIWQKEPRVLNRIDMDEEYIKLMQRGMELVTEGDGTAAGSFGNFPVKVAAKTGTAQTGTHKNHTLLVGYAPAEDPQIAFAIIAPFSQDGIRQTGSLAQIISREILEVFFGVHPEYNNVEGEDGTAEDDEDDNNDADQDDDE